MLVKPTVAYIDAFTVRFVFQIAVSMAEGICSGIIPILHGPGICQLAAGADRTRENICQCVSAFHAALTVEQHCVDPYFI